MKNGQITLLVGMMLTVIIIFLALALAPAMKQTIDEQRADPQVDCSNTSISDQNKAVCTSMDSLNLYIGIILGTAGIVLWRVVG